MSRRSLVNVLLGVLVAAAAAAVYLLPSDRGTASFPLLPVPVETLQRIEIERAGKPTIVLVREGSRWQLQAPIRGRVEELPVARLLDLAGAASEQRMPATGLERFELDKPWAQLRFDSHAVALGMSNPLTRELYAKSGEYVLTLPARVAADVPAEPAKLLARRLFDPQERPTGFSLPGFTMQLYHGRWQLEPQGDSASQDDLARWVDHWRLASSIVTQPAGDGPALATAEIEMKGGAKVEIDVRAYRPNLVLRRTDEGLEYHFPSGLAEVLLVRPDAAPGSRP